MRYLSSFAAFALVSCTTTTAPMAERFCDDFLTWADNGPRQIATTSTRKAHFPSSGDCYNARSTDDGADIFSCLTINWACPTEKPCADEADTTFLKAAFRYSHYWTEFSYFQNIGTCLGAIESVAPWHSDASNLSHSYTIVRKGNRFDLGYDTVEKITKIEITYDINN